MHEIEAPTLVTIQDDIRILGYEVTYNGCTTSFAREKRAERYFNVLQESHKVYLERMSGQEPMQEAEDQNDTAEYETADAETTD